MPVIVRDAAPPPGDARTRAPRPRRGPGAPAPRERRDARVFRGLGRGAHLRPGPCRHTGTGPVPSRSRFAPRGIRTDTRHGAVWLRLALCLGPAFRGALSELPRPPAPERAPTVQSSSCGSGRACPEGESAAPAGRWPIPETRVAWLLPRAGRPVSVGPATSSLLPLAPWGWACAFRLEHTGQSPALWAES